MNKEPNSRAPVERPVMPNAVGHVSYDVCVACPHCGKSLHLNQYPYNDDQTEYSMSEDDLGLALFGTAQEPAKWEALNIKYTCCGCKQEFSLSGLDI